MVSGHLGAVAGTLGQHFAAKSTGPGLRCLLTCQVGVEPETLHFQPPVGDAGDAGTQSPFECPRHPSCLLR